MFKNFLSEILCVTFCISSSLFASTPKERVEEDYKLNLLYQRMMAESLWDYALRSKNYRPNVRMVFTIKKNIFYYQGTEPDFTPQNLSYFYSEPLVKKGRPFKVKPASDTTLEETEKLFRNQVCESIIKNSYLDSLHQRVKQVFEQAYPDLKKPRKEVFLSEILKDRDLKIAYQAYDTKNYETAFHHFNKSFKKKNIEAAFMMGILYYKGRGVEKDYGYAYEFFRQAAEENYAPAQFYLSNLYQSPELNKSPDPTQSKNNFNRAFSWCYWACFQHYKPALKFVYEHQEEFFSSEDYIENFMVSEKIKGKSNF